MIIIGVVLFVSAVIAAALVLWQPQANTAEIYQNGELIIRLSLSQNAETNTYTIENETGWNIITVDNGRVRVSDADCPDRACVHQGWLSGAAPIVCLPHRLVIKLVKTETNNFDAIA